MEKDRSIKFLFEATSWHANELQPVVLTQVFRQRDAHFVALLDEMRRAALSPFSIAQLHQLPPRSSPPPSPLATRVAVRTPRRRPPPPSPST
jgi:hypothetical protein